jgi:hypothetical protein
VAASKFKVQITDAIEFPPPIANLNKIYVSLLRSQPERSVMYLSGIVWARFADSRVCK